MNRGWAGRAAALAALLLTALSVALAGTSLASAAPRAGQVYLVQALARTTGDLVVDGATVRPAAGAGTVVGPLSLAPGQHLLEVRDGASTLVGARFTVSAGESLDVVAHRASDKAMSPAITVFRNDTAAVAPGKTRLVVSHVAVAEPSDIRVDGKAFFRNVANGESLSLVVPARSYAVDVVATTAADRAILAPVRLSLRAGTLTRVFVMGNPDDGTSDAIVQVLPVRVVGAPAPSAVHTGDGGQAADEFVRTRPLWPALAAGGAAVLCALLAGALRGANAGAAVTARAGVSRSRSRSRR